MSIRNNEDRTGERRASGADAPPQVVAPDSASSSSRPLDFTTPTEFVDLPSRGRFYAEDHPLHNKDSVEIRYMTAKDEDILTSKSLLKKGVAIDRFLQNIIIDKNIQLSTLLVGDKNALIIAARITGYGSDYNTKVTCPACGETQEHSFDLEKNSMTAGGSEGFEEKYDQLADEVNETENNTWFVRCPKSEVTVELKLLTGVEEKFMINSQALKKKQKLPETLLTDQLRVMIVSVNGDATQHNINKFIDVMPAMDSRFVRGAYDKIMPNVDLTQEFECNSCSFVQDMEVPFTADFFWPRR